MMNRIFMQELLAEAVTSGMDWETLNTFAKESLVSFYSGLTDDEFIEAVNEYAPHLLEETEDER